ILLHAYLFPHFGVIIVLTPGFMRLHLSLFFSLVLLATFSFAQEPDRGMMWATNGLKSHAVLVDKFSIPTTIPGRNVLVLEVPFAKAEFISPALAAAARGKLIEK